jgi:hypothetical protein
MCGKTGQHIHRDLPRYDTYIDGIRNVPLDDPDMKKNIYNMVHTCSQRPVFRGRRFRIRRPSGFYGNGRELLLCYHTVGMILLLLYY